MNKKGFTLVELLGVIVILSILMVIVVTPIMGQIRNNASRLDETALKILYSSTDAYLDMYKNDYEKSNGMTYYISLGQLIENGDLASSYLDAYSEDVLSVDSAIKVQVTNGGYLYELADNSSIDSLDSAYNKMDNTGTYNYMGGTYASGSVTNNYVYYSGFLWRIMGKNEDGSIKLISEEQVTSLYYGNIDYLSSSDGAYYSSYVHDWLNDYFISRLKYSDIVLKSRECSVLEESSSSTTDCTSSTSDQAYKESYVNMLSLSEYNLSFLNSNSYLKNATAFATNTLTTKNLVYYVNVNGGISTAGSSAPYYIRPVINVLSSSIITSGTGTNTDPYILVKKNRNITSGDSISINNVNLSIGEYVNISDIDFRVVENDKKEVKLILNELVQDSNGYYTSVYNTEANTIYSKDFGIGNYLNGSFVYSFSNINDKIKTDIWYQGNTIAESLNYKLSSLSKSNIIYDIKIGLPKIGELLTVPLKGINTNTYWTMTMYSSSEVMAIGNESVSSAYYASSHCIRPVIVIDASTLVSSGSGTSSSPYVIE